MVKTLPTKKTLGFISKFMMLLKDEMMPFLHRCYQKIKEGWDIMQNVRLDEAQAGIKTAVRNINNLRYTDDTTLMAEREEELKRLLMRAKEKNEKADLTPNIQKTKIMASGHITSRQTDGETMETETIFLGSKKSLQMVTAAMKLKDTCSLEGKL